MSTQHQWFTESRFGMFVHFGLYSMLARHEWVMTQEQTPVEEYSRLAPHFDPDLFDAAHLARRAREAGMKYVVLTTKHHEGFALFNSAVSDYNITTYTGRDLVAEFVEAVRAEGLKVGFYFSLLDWSHPDYVIDYHHPLREHPEARTLNESRDMGRYREFLFAQAREILTNYGTIDYLFYDFTYAEPRGDWEGKYPQDWHAEELLALTRELQPGVIVNDRLGIPADLVTPEQYQPTEPMRRDGEDVVWEACQTMNGTWGYHRDNLDFKSHELLVNMLIATVSNNGNLLLNIGPDGRGAITPVDEATLSALGEWMRLHSASIYGAGAHDGTLTLPGTVITAKPGRLYLHLTTWPFGHLHLPGMAEKVSFARFLHDGSQVLTETIDPDQAAWNTQPGGQSPGTLTLNLPVRRPDVLVPVIELFLDD